MSVRPRTVNLVNIDKKELKISKFKRVLDKIGYTSEHKPLYAFLYLDKINGLTLRVFGNLESDDDIIEIIKKDQVLKKYETLPQINYEQVTNETLDRLDRIVNKFENTDINKVINIESIDKYRNDQFPYFLDVIATYDNGTTETLFAFGCDYIKKDDEVIVNLLSDSFFNDDLVPGTTLKSKYIKTDTFEGLVLKEIVDDEK